ncbi:hypothetical protein HRD50_42335, partial [Corallococcus exiguus]|nr:hypothetical protein [Corallococcus exiguus]
MLRTALATTARRLGIPATAGLTRLATIRTALTAAGTTAALLPATPTLTTAAATT